MAVLTADQVLKRIAKPLNKTYIDLAVFQEERLFLHAEAILEKFNLPFTSFRNFTSWWQALISEVKYNRIDELLNCPLFTVGVVKDIFDQLQKFLDAQDRYTEYKFSEYDMTNDYSEYLKKINDDTFWRQRIINELKTGICSYVVTDLPQTQTTDRPEPYNYFVSPRLVFDVDINKFTGNVEYIIFRQSDFYWDGYMNTIGGNTNLTLIPDGDMTEKVIAIDDKSYKVFVRPLKKLNGWGTMVADGITENKWELLSENPHKLGYCPVIDFWKDSIKGSNGINKIGPITLQLSNLDYLLFFKACIDYMNLYGPFPIMVTYDMEENQWDDKTKEINTGNTYDIGKTSAISNANQSQDPRSSGRKLLGPGGGIKVPAGADGSDFDFMENPMKFIGMSPENVKLANELLEQFESKIKEKCTGIDEDYLNEIAKNAEMLAASFRKEDTILNWISSNVERVHKFVTDTRCRLRYGNKYYLGCVIDYGSDRLLKDATTLTKEFEEAKTGGMPQEYCAEIANIATITRFCNNPEKLARFRIFADLEPYPIFSLQELVESGISLNDEINFIIKVNFVTFVSRFELEQKCSIVQFGSLINYGDKINLIKSKFKEYAGSIKWTKPAVEVQGKPKPVGSGKPKPVV